MGRDHGRTGAPHHHAGRRPPPDLAVEIFAADRRWREALQEFFRGHDGIGTGDAFAKGRDFAAWLGLVPKQISTGDRTILGKISKRGNRYLRVLFCSIRETGVTRVPISMTAMVSPRARNKFPATTLSRSSKSS
jgi:transposase